MGGSNNDDNLIDLYAHEHFLAHKLLAEENPNDTKLVTAYTMMAFTRNDKNKENELLPEEYEEARISLSNLMKKKWQDKNYRSLQAQILKKRWEDPEYRKKQSESRTKLNYKIWEDENHRKNMGKKSKERWNNMSNEELKKQRESMKAISNKLWKDNEYIKRHCTPVFCIETQEYFLCQQDAVKKYHFSPSGLSSNLSGRQKSAGKHPITGEPLHWKKVTWDECKENISKVYHSDKINLLIPSED